MPKFHVHRSIEINAAPEKVFEVIADYSTWTTWSPWLIAEPDAQVKITGSPGAVGSIYSWKGNIVGAGEIEHLNLVTDKKIEDEIRFTLPFKSKSKVEFDIEPVGSNTRVTWHMHGSLPWFLFWMVTQMMTYIGMDYERGLKMLKEWIETGEIQSQTLNHGIEQIGPLKVLGVRRKCHCHEVGDSMEMAFAAVKEQFTQRNLPLDGQVISVYHHMDCKERTFDYTAGFTVTEAPTELPEGLTLWSIPAVPALLVEHIGRYDHLGNSWSAAHQYVRAKKLKKAKHSEFEIYLNDPATTPPGELQTKIYIPLKST